MRTVLFLAALLIGAGRPSAGFAAFDVAERYDVPAPLSTADRVVSDNQPPAVVPQRRPVVPLAQGFGRDVPLAFAIRQIVPAGVRLTLADGVDPDAPVVWRGGRPWTKALGEAVTPLGLRLVATPRGWTIRR